ncbi:hypothetical protein THASP1DRAFT_33528 [Thamnocephalis sphaerospora]|uniref:F-box domain-containing protein n=1 Tax=Thamnocephalis sphaerospora TaxID=78915 RepID=A0A4P9XGB5_9FUNG|nr:hypothetical protein THASP1DRAFT_33528 [Thamnocephalis sphaerospora]|eukprot:RKP04675.1 hypothetical protein THASP1DRAFT_33528 [Thamnocephalis sphaerospora]
MYRLEKRCPKLQHLYTYHLQREEVLNMVYALPAEIRTIWCANIRFDNWNEQMDLNWFTKYRQLETLVVHGATPFTRVIHGFPADIVQLRQLRKLSCMECYGEEFGRPWNFEIIGQLDTLESLTIGSCDQWRPHEYQQLGKLTRLTHLGVTRVGNPPAVPFRAPRESSSLEPRLYDYRKYRECPYTWHPVNISVPISWPYHARSEDELFAAEDHFAIALSNLTSLRHLELSNCNIGHATCHALATHPTLSHATLVFGSPARLDTHVDVLLQFARATQSLAYSRCIIPYFIGADIRPRRTQDMQRLDHSASAIVCQMLRENPRIHVKLERLEQ